MTYIYICATYIAFKHTAMAMIRRINPNEMVVNYIEIFPQKQYSMNETHFTYLSTSIDR